MPIAAQINMSAPLSQRLIGRRTGLLPHMRQASITPKLRQPQGPLMLQHLTIFELKRVTG
jgi:hypothetical protein